MSAHPDPTWRDAALCRNSPLPWTRTERAEYRDLLVMVSVCERCPVMDDCREDMHARGDFVGVRAGVAWTQPGGSTPAPSARRIEQRVCAWCGQPYDKPAEIRWTKYCSNGCRNKGRRELDAASQRARKAAKIHNGNGVNGRSELESGLQNSGPGAALTARDLADTPGGVDVSESTR